MKYIPFPPTCGIDLVDVDEDKKTAVLHIPDLMKQNLDSDPLPTVKSKAVEVEFKTIDDILDAIEKYGYRRPLRLDETK